MAKTFANTPGKRFLKLTGMTARVAGKYTSTKIKSTLKSDQVKEEVYSEMYAEIGEQVLKTLGEMKGAAMKVGQIASQLSHMLPEEFASKLTQLQKHSEPMPYDVIARQIKRELGYEPEKLFKRFEKEPFAAASIGQVHRAVTNDGREIVMKIQYPGVYESCRSDLIQLKHLFSLSGLMKIDKESLDEVFDEIEEKLMQELDYQTEADNLREFKAFHQDFNKVVIPEVIDEYTTERILTLTYEHGHSLEELAENNYSQEEINGLAVVLVEAMLREILYNEKAHCDPHPGNFAFRKSGELIIYDYGCVADMRDMVIDHYIDIITAGLNGEFHRVDDMLLDLGVRNPNESRVDAAIYEAWWNDFVVPVLEEPELKTIVNKIQQGIKKHMTTFIRLRGSFQLSADTLFLNRVLSGHFLNLAQMGVDIDLKPIVLDHLFDDEE